MEAVIDALEAVATPVFVAVRHRPLSPDAGDDMVLDVAINGGADAVVTANLRDFRRPAEAFGIRVHTPRTFLLENRK